MSVEENMREMEEREQLGEGKFGVDQESIMQQLRKTHAEMVDNETVDLDIPNYKGQLVGKQRDTNGSTFVSGVINIEALRHHRESAQVTNWMKDVRSELAQIIYEKPIYPKNRYLKKVPPKHADYKRDVIDKQVALMQKRGIWKKPSH